MTAEATHGAEPSEGTVLAAVRDRLVAMASQHRDDELPPVALLLPDEDGSWALVATELHQAGVGAYVLGDFDPDRGVGPALWLRTIVDTGQPGRPPILVLPGVRPSDLRVSGPREDLRVLVDVALRGQVLVNRAGHEVRFEDFLADERDGLGLSVRLGAGDSGALRGALAAIMDAPLRDLKHRTLRPADLRALVLGHDPQRRLLEWLSDPDSPWVTNAERDEWAAFRSQCREEWGFDPETDGPLTAAELLARADGTWEHVWSRFEEAAARYPGVVERLRQLGEPPNIAPSHLPSANVRMELELARGLLDIASGSRDEACAAVESLELKHGSRRDSVWSSLGEAPLANALAALMQLASAEQPRSASISQLVDWWSAGGYAADDACMRALATCAGDDDRAAVAAALRAIYGPWLDDLARQFQELLRHAPNAERPRPPDSFPEGICLVFVDGLRADIGHRLARQLSSFGRVSISWRMAPLPTITPTGKPAVVPVSLDFRAGRGFDLVGPDGGAVNAPALRRMLEAAGWAIVDPASPTSATAKGWCELGSASLDELGHQAVDRFAERIPALLDDIVRSVRRLMSAGWRHIRIVTDHGFLYLPGGFAKSDLPQHLTSARKPRCARLTDGAGTQPLEAPWVWAQDERIAFPLGTAVFELGSVYEHGGMSLQECIVPTVDVLPRDAGAAALTIEAKWVRLRCYVSASPGAPGAAADLRRAPADASSSVARAPRDLDEESTAALVLDEEKLAGQDPENIEVWAVIVGPDGRLLAQQRTKAGE
jgi:hypothetical protein